MERRRLLAAAAVATVGVAALGAGPASAAVARGYWEWVGLPTWNGGWGPWRNIILGYQSIRYKERDYGINLGWTDDWRKSNVYVFANGSSAGAPILPDTRVALWIPQGGYLRFGNRAWGIELVWSASPVYEC
jgi:hypothetical protein